MALLGHPDANPIGELRGVLGALRADIDAGQLLPFSQRVRAEVFSDLLGQAGYLNGEGYHRAACVLAGAVLEDHLKHLAVRHNIPVTTSTGKPRQAADINTDLMKPGGAYGKPEWAMVAAWQQSRNQAAHGDPDFDKAHDHAMVHRMIDGVRSFVSKYPV